MDWAQSIRGRKVRLPDERWRHIVENHDELAGLFYDVLEAVERPDYVIKGLRGELLAVRQYRDGKWIVVVYKESADDGFIITAYLTSKVRSLLKREILWRHSH